jgi:predicted nucleotidyltransferase component of viral defense system
MDSSSSGLTEAQRRLIRAFFQRTQEFFLTGGSALAGFYLHHRTSADLELFTTSDAAFGQGRRVLEDAVRSAGGRLESVREYPGFAEYRAEIGGENVKVDLVRDSAPQAHSEKVRMDEAVVDTLDDIAANKICTILGRSEIRDIIDLFFLEQAGQDLGRAIAMARAKDGGVEAATLAWVLGQVKVRTVPSTLLKPLSATELQSFVDRVSARLATEAFPSG